MNRIYFGAATKVEVVDVGSGVPVELPNWRTILWKHHELFQNAVNYYSLCFAAMAVGLKEDSVQGRAAARWRDQVKATWKEAERKTRKFPGPHERIARLLNLDPDKAGFDDCARAVVKQCKASAQAQASAFLQLLEEADGSDLNQMAVGRLPWFCTPKGMLDATSKSVATEQEIKMLEQIRMVHEADASGLPATAAKVEPGFFVTQFPKEKLEGNEAKEEALRLFRAAAQKTNGISRLEDLFAKELDKLGSKLALPLLGRKPKGAYPFAVIFKFLPVEAVWEAFKKATAKMAKKTPPSVQTDQIAEARVHDQPFFDYFSNIAMARESGSRDRAVWFDFDLAAFIEAVKSPHRYFQDTLKREKAAEVLRAKMAEIEGRGGKPDDEHDEDEEATGPFGFEGDERIDLILKLIFQKLYVGEGESAAIDKSTPFLTASLKRLGIEPEPGRPEFTVQERTLRSFADIRKKWRALAEKGPVSQDQLLEELKAQQSKHREDFGSRPLYQALADPTYQKIWRDAGTKPWHATDPIKAWLIYNELRSELRDTERAIRFTPAHPVNSPRYFIFPKMGRLGSDHLPRELAFTCGIVKDDGRIREPINVRVSYSAPRLCRDELRHQGDTQLKSVAWLQPMMKALGLPDPDMADFSNCRITLQPKKMEPTVLSGSNKKDLDESLYNIQLTFPVEVEPEKLITTLGKQRLWYRQFNVHPDGDDFYSATLRWPHEKQGSKPPPPWHETLNRFRVMATDLGQRDAGAIAVLDVRANNDWGKKPTRFVGETSGKNWRAALEASGLLRLSGEDRKEWRAPSKTEQARGEKDFGWREELFGERGRNASPDETAQCCQLLTGFLCEADAKELDEQLKTLSFPEQNDKLLWAARRAQSRVSRLHRWCWFLTDPKHEAKVPDVLEEISTLEEENILPASVKQMAKAGETKELLAELKQELSKRQRQLPMLLVLVANRCLPLRPEGKPKQGREWAWNPHPDSKARESGCRLLEIVESQMPMPKIRGQRGLSLERIEQIEELRRRFQALNQALRRVPGEPPKKSRDESIPDPCPDLLEKLDRIKEQRVNQTAHMILAEALGVRLATPPANKRELLHERDQHGIYEKFREPVDFIVIEDLSRYRASQGRAPRENSRLMKWCHRAIRDKLKQLCEIFGMPVLETPAAWSSRFCSRSGAAGFRAVEVTKGFDSQSPWLWLKEQKEKNKEEYTNEAKSVQELIRQVERINAGRDGKKLRTLLAPQTGGPIFIPIVEDVRGADIPPALAQADINAAINLALRAIANPCVWSIYPRLRTQRLEKGGVLLAREKRKFGDKAKKPITLREPANKDEAETRQPNFFADMARCAKWGYAELEGEDVPLVSGIALWTTVKQSQWKRVQEINEGRFRSLKNKEDDVPM